MDKKIYKILNETEVIRILQTPKLNSKLLCKEKEKENSQKHNTLYTLELAKFHGEMQ